MKVIPYLNFGGTAEAAVNFYVHALDAKIESMSRFGDAPQMPVSEEHKNNILHGRFTIGESLVMVSDGMHGENYSGNNISMSIDFSDVEDMKAKFEKLSEDGKITMPVQDTFWGATFGMLTDKYGINWMFNFDKQPADNYNHDNKSIIE